MPKPAECAPATSSTNSFAATSGLDSMAGDISGHQIPVVHPNAVDTDLCKCLICYYPGCSSIKFSGWKQNCTFPGCDELSGLSEFYRDGRPMWKRSQHEISHYFHQGAFKCQEEHCTVTTKTFTDLKRHYASRHCKKSKKHACHHVGCKYSGENGFARKDKLTSHLRNVHEGKVPHNQPPRAIQPKAQAPTL